MSGIEQSFIKEYEANVHLAYQTMGSKLRPTVRNKTNVRAKTATFHKVGSGSAQTKSRHGTVPSMGITYATVDCDLEDYYAGDWVDHLDELKTNVQEQKILANTSAYALGRKTDELIITQLNKATQKISANSKGLTKEKILKAFELLGTNNVPDDGQRYAVIGWKQWIQLLDIDEFKNAQYVGSDETLPWKSAHIKSWLGTTWIAHSGLTIDSVKKERKCYWYHKTAIGHASGLDIKTDITWHGDHAAHFVNSYMSQGASLIDNQGIVQIVCIE